MKQFFSILFCLLLLVSACRLGPRYSPPQVCAPEAWKAASVQGPPKEVRASPCVQAWWTVFNDPTLDQLEGQAVANNPTLAITVQKILEARGYALEAGAALYPQVNLNPSYTDTGELFQIFLPNALNIPGVTNNIPSVFRIHQFQYFLPLSVNYEIDLWGKIRSQYDSALYNLQASMLDYQASMLTLTSDLASTYFQMRSLDAQIDVLENSLESRRKELHIAQSRFKSGLATKQDALNAEVQLESAKSLLIDTKRQRIVFENAIATYTGVPASLFLLPHNPLSGPPPVIPAGTPTDILLQRPDIAEAERHNASEQALIGAAIADFFPSLSISGVIGYFSPTLKDFMTWKSRFWQIGADSSQMVFDGGFDEGNLEVAWSRFRQASLNYQQTVLTAFQEVEDALTDIDYRSQQHEVLKKASAAARENLDLSTRRYRQGLIFYLEVVINERAQLDTDLNLVNTLGLQYVATVQLIKALGGSW